MWMLSSYLQMTVESLLKLSRISNDVESNKKIKLKTCHYKVFSKKTNGFRQMTSTSPIYVILTTSVEVQPPVAGGNSTMIGLVVS